MLRMVPIRRSPLPRAGVSKCTLWAPRKAQAWFPGSPWGTFL